MTICVTIDIQGRDEVNIMSTIAVRVDDKLKAEAAELFDLLGIDMSTAVKMFLIQSVQTRSIPFARKYCITLRVKKASFMLFVRV